MTFLYKLSSFCDRLDPYIIIRENDSIWYACKDTPQNRTWLTIGDEWRVATRNLQKFIGEDRRPSKRYTLDREETLDFLARSLRKTIERLKDLSMRADAVEMRDEAAMKKFGVI